MRVELFGVARARAGAARVELEAEDLGGALAELARSCPGLVPDVIEGGVLAKHFLVSLGGERFIRDPATPLTPRDTLLLLGAQAGG